MTRYLSRDYLLAFLREFRSEMQAAVVRAREVAEDAPNDVHWSLGFFADELETDIKVLDDAIEHAEKWGEE